MNLAAMPFALLLVLVLQALPSSLAAVPDVCQKDTCDTTDVTLHCLTGGTIVYGECGLQEALCSAEAIQMGITVDPTGKCVDCSQFPNRPWC